MFKLLFYSALLYVVYSYFARLGRLERLEREEERKRAASKRPQSAKKNANEEYVDYEEM